MPLVPPLTRHELQGQKDIAHRKQVQARISQASAALGLGGMGVVGASILARKKPKLLKIKPQNAKEAADKWSQRGIYTSVAGTGVGSGSSLYFAGTQKKEAAMSNEALKRQKLSAIGKAYKKVAVDPTSPAWQQAADPMDQRWRNKVSASAERAHDFALEPSRRKEQEHRHRANVAGNIGAGSLVGGTLATIALRKRPRFAVPSAITGAVGTGAGFGVSRQQTRTADRWGESARKIRARGFQRLEDEGKVGKAAGGFVVSRVVPAGGRFVSRRAYAIPRIRIRRR